VSIPPTPPLQRRVAACAIVTDAAGRILLHRRTDNGLWSLPGGTIEPEETAAAACIREVLEETGILAQADRLIGVYSDPAYTTMTYPDGNRIAYVALLFACTAIGGTPQTCDESSEVGWFDPGALPNPFTRHHVQRVHDALAQQAAAFVR
jgi:8-oxo-dGTP diphosphatase